MIVVDASVVVETLLASETGLALANRLLDPEETLHAPQLVDVEVGQVLRRFTLSGQVDASRAGWLLDDLHDLPLTRHDHQPLLRRAWQHRHNVTLYDGVYLALAEGLGAPLLTRDVRLARAAPPGLTVEIV